MWLLPGPIGTFPLGPLSPPVRSLTSHLEILCGEALRGSRRAQLSNSPTKALIMDNQTESPRLKEKTEEKQHDDSTRQDSAMSPMRLWENRNLESSLTMAKQYNSAIETQLHHE